MWSVLVLAIISQRLKTSKHIGSPSAAFPSAGGMSCIPSPCPLSLHSYLKRDLRGYLNLWTPLQDAQMHLLNKWTLISEQVLIIENDAQGDLRAVCTHSLSLFQHSICASGWVRCEPRGRKTLDVSIRLNSRNRFLFGVTGIWFHTKSILIMQLGKM